MRARGDVSGLGGVGIFFSSRRRHTRFDCDWSSDVCSSDLGGALARAPAFVHHAGMGRIFEVRKATMFARWNRMAKQFARIAKDLTMAVKARSEERRVGKECRSRWSPDH